MSQHPPAPRRFRLSPVTRRHCPRPFATSLDSRRGIGLAQPGALGLAALLIGAVLPAGAQTYLIDFGGADTTSRGSIPNDPVNFWNNVTTATGASSTARLTNLVTAGNAPTTVGLAMLSRFNGANENGTLASPHLPPNATRDSLFGNTETFSGLANIFPSFKLVGLDPEARYAFTFYASRLGVSDNRETGYTVTGLDTGFAALNVANNVTNTARVTGIRPNPAREITISLAPTPNNNNANHFTYLGALRVDAGLPPPRFLPLALTGGQVRLDWTGNGRLESAPAVTGPWTPITPAPTPPYTEAVAEGATRFYRLRQ